MLIDTHTHIHDTNFFNGSNNKPEALKGDRDALYKEAVDSGVEKILCIGVDLKSSTEAVDFSQGKEGCFAVVGLHPHDAEHSEEEIAGIRRLLEENKGGKIVAIGECGLDYYYENSQAESQKKVLVKHFELAKEFKLPMVFHIRGSGSNPNDAFADFWPIFERFKTEGVVHSFSAFKPQLEAILDHDLHVGINGIVTFTIDEQQRDTMLSVPLDRLLLETDSPFLTPIPFRGKINTSKNTKLVAEFIAEQKNLTIDEIANKTTSNANQLFGL